MVVVVVVVEVVVVGVVVVVADSSFPPPPFPSLSLSLAPSLSPHSLAHFPQDSRSTEVETCPTCNSQLPMASTHSFTINGL